jgi:hypothetical protein
MFPYSFHIPSGEANIGEKIICDALFKNYTEFYLYIKNIISYCSKYYPIFYCCAVTVEKMYYSNLCKEKTESFYKYVLLLKTIFVFLCFIHLIDLKFSIWACLNGKFKNFFFLHLYITRVILYAFWLNLLEFNIF